MQETYSPALQSSFHEATKAQGTSITADSFRRKTIDVLKGLIQESTTDEIANGPEWYWTEASNADQFDVREGVAIRDVPALLIFARHFLRRS